jgi:hypothetical protein
MPSPMTTERPDSVGMGVIGRAGMHLEPLTVLTQMRPFVFRRLELKSAYENVATAPTPSHRVPHESSARSAHRDMIDQPRTIRAAGNAPSQFDPTQKSLDVLKELLRLPEQRPKLPPLVNRCFPIPTVLERVLIASWRARPRRATVHPTTLFSMDCRRLTRFA